jgi:signal transduction histidine kinase
MAEPTPSQPSGVRHLVTRFNFAFGLMSIIPLLTCLYVITVRLFSFKVLEGMNGVYFLLALVIALLGLLAGHEVIRDIFRQLVEANAKLQRMYDQQAAFVSNVAHEFRSPLAVFKGALDNLGDGLHGPLTRDQAEPVAICRTEINRLSRLVSDLLDIARLEAGRLSLAQQPVVLQDTLQSVAQLFGGLAKERGLALTLDLPTAPLIVVGDGDRLKQVFVNLIANALKFTTRGDIRIRLSKNGEAAQVDVEDTGPGIAREDLERIFDKFERVGTQAEEGSGLGLPIARNLVQLHHGRIWAESGEGQGSRFIVRLPLRPRGS